MRKPYRIVNKQTSQIANNPFATIGEAEERFKSFDQNQFEIQYQKLNIIAACNKDNVIGIDGKIPWHYPEDLKFFKSKTLNSTVIMGRKTAESLPRKLKDRNVIILSKSTVNIDLDYSIVSSLEIAIECASFNKGDIWIAGGGEIYDQVLRESEYFQVNEIFLTLVPDIVNIEQAKNVVYFPRKLLYKPSFSLPSMFSLSEKLDYYYIFRY